MKRVTEADVKAAAARTAELREGLAEIMRDYVPPTPRPSLLTRVRSWFA